MYKLRPINSLTQGITYTLTNLHLCALMAGVFFVQVLLNIGYRMTAEEYPGAEYLYDFLSHIFFIWWYLVVAIIVLSAVRKEKKGLFYAISRGAIQTWGACWLIVWMTLLSWARISLIREPYCVTEGIDLILLLIVSFIAIIQLALNFFMIPEIADKNYAILRLYVSAFDGLRKQFFRMVQFFLLLLVLGVVVALIFLIIIVVTRTLTECVVLCPWMPRIVGVIVEAGVTTVILTILVVVQTLFYLEYKVEA